MTLIFVPKLRQIVQLTRHVYVINYNLLQLLIYSKNQTKECRAAYYMCFSVHASRTNLDEGSCLATDCTTCAVATDTKA